VLYALIEAEQKDGFAPLNQLSVEHILPQKLTPAWKRELGENASELHGKWKHRLPKLTLVGAEFTNPNLGAKTFREKKYAKYGYAKSALGMTQRLSDFNAWNEDSLRKRADDLASRVLERWPWQSSRKPDTQESRTMSRSIPSRFWKCLRTLAAGLPGQHDGWRGPDQRTEVLNSHEDRLGVHVGGAGDARAASLPPEVDRRTHVVGGGNAALAHPAFEHQVEDVEVDAHHHVHAVGDEPPPQPPQQPHKTWRAQQGILEAVDGKGVQRR